MYKGTESFVEHYSCFFDAKRKVLFRSSLLHCIILNFRMQQTWKKYCLEMILLMYICVGLPPIVVLVSKLNFPLVLFKSVPDKSMIDQIPSFAIWMFRIGIDCMVREGFKKEIIAFSIKGLTHSPLPTTTAIHWSP